MIDPGTAMLIGGGLSFLGGERRNRAQIASAREQMAFQREMADTGYQRAAADLEKAGLNRILALGNAAPSPGGAQAQIQDTITPAVTSAMTASQTQSNVGLQDMQTFKTHMEGIAQDIKNNISMLRDLPEARADHWKTRIKSDLVEYAENLMRQHGDQGTAHVMSSEEGQELRQIMTSLKRQNFALYKQSAAAMAQALEGSAEGLAWLNELFGGVPTSAQGLSAEEMSYPIGGPQ